MIKQHERAFRFDFLPSFLIVIFDNNNDRKTNEPAVPEFPQLPDANQRFNDFFVIDCVFSHSSKGSGKA